MSSEVANGGRGGGGVLDKRTRETEYRRGGTYMAMGLLPTGAED